MGGGAEAELKRILYNNQKLDEVMPIFVQKCQLLLILLAALWNKISMTWKITFGQQLQQSESRRFISFPDAPSMYSASPSIILVTLEAGSYYV